MILHKVKTKKITNTTIAIFSKDEHNFNLHNTFKHKIDMLHKYSNLLYNFLICFFRNQSWIFVNK